MNELQVEWVEVNTPKSNRKVPAWARHAAMDENGTVYIPAGLAGNETKVLLIIGWSADSVVIERDEHLYAPVAVMIRDFPQFAVEFKKIETMVRDCLRVQ